MSSATHAIVLAAGLGLRLRPLTLVRAKPAIPVAGEPLIRRILRWLVSNDVTDVVINLHHLPATITSLVGDGSDLGVRVRYSWEQPVVLGSAGGIRHALDVLRSRSFFIVNGDTLTDLPLAALAAAHASSNALITMALTENREPHRYGGVMLDEKENVTGFVRAGSAAEKSYHFIGVQIADAEAFAGLERGVPLNSIGGTYDQLIARSPGSIRGFRTDAAFWDIGTLDDYRETDRRFRETTR